MYCKVGKARHLLDEHSLKSGKWVWNLDSFAHKFRKENTKYFIERERERFAGVMVIKGEMEKDSCWAPLQHLVLLP